VISLEEQVRNDPFLIQVGCKSLNNESELYHGGKIDFHSIKSDIVKLELIM